MARCIVGLLFVLVVTQAEARNSPAGCPARLWCGCWLAQQFNIVGTKARELWLARNWLQYQKAPLAPGAVAVFSRGRRGGHVGKVLAVKPGKVLLMSGNDGGRVRTRWRSTNRLIGTVSITVFASAVHSRPAPLIDRSNYQGAGEFHDIEDTHDTVGGDPLSGELDHIVLMDTATLVRDKEEVVDLLHRFIVPARSPSPEHIGHVGLGFAEPF